MGLTKTMKMNFNLFNKKKSELPISQKIIILFLCFFATNFANSQLYTVTTTGPESIEGYYSNGIDSAFYTLERTSEIGFNDLFDPEGGSLGIQLRTDAPDDISSWQTLFFEASPIQYGCETATITFVKVRQSNYNNASGFNHPSSFTISWGGGGSAVIDDPDDQIFGYESGDLIGSGTTIALCNNVTNDEDTWGVTVPGDEVTVHQFNDNSCTGESGYKLNKEWLNFEILMSTVPYTISPVCEYGYGGDPFVIDADCTVEACEGTSLYLSVLPDDMVSSYWTTPSGDEIEGTGGNDLHVSPSISIDDAGVYIVEIQDSNGCLAETAIEVYVEEVDSLICEAFFSETWNLIPTCELTLCEGEPLILSVDPDGLDSYEWTGPGGFNALGNTDGDVTVSDAVSPTDAGNYTVTIPSDFGCEQFATIEVFVNERPPIDAGADFEICIGDEATLSGTGAGVGGTYLWDGAVTDGAAFSPEVTNTYMVAGTDANGCVNTDEITITVNPLPIIDAGADFEICIGDETSLSGSGAGVGGTYLWDGAVMDGEAFSPEVTDTYTVTGTDANGCVNTDEITITVNPLPVIDAGADFEICIGDETSLSGSGAGVGGTYLWDGAVMDGEAFSPEVTDTYTVTGTDANGCVNTDEITITVNPLPVIDAGADFEICIGDETSLSGSGAGVGGTYLWDGAVMDGEAFSPEVTDTYTVTGTDANGCVNTDEITITVNPLPVIDAGDDFEICIGDETTLSGSGAGVGGTYLWDGAVMDGEAFSPEVTDTYTVTGTDANGCVNTDEITITVNPLPIIDAGADFEICIGDETSLSGSGAGVGGTYLWDGAVMDGEAFSPEVTDTYTVTGTDANGCVNTDNINIIVHLLPEVLFTVSKFQLCAPETVNFTALAPATLYFWDFGDGGAGLGSDLAHTYEVTGFHDVELIVESDEGCVNSVIYENYIEVIDHPIAEFKTNSDLLSILNTSVETLNLSTFASDFIWDFGDGSEFSFETEPTHMYSEIGNQAYTITLQASNDFGCSDTYSQLITVNDDLIFFIPNAFSPDGDLFNGDFKPVFSSGLDIYDYHLTIFNQWGEIVFESYDVNYGWNGVYGNDNKSSQAVFIWQIEFGDTMSDNKHTEKGHVTLLK